MFIIHISSPLAILTTLTSITAFFYFMEQKTRWKLFTYFPPLLFIYAIPMVMSSLGVLAHEGPVYDWMSSTVLPFMLAIMLLKVDIKTAIQVMGKGILVMLCGTAGVILGAPLAYLVVRNHLDPGAWKAFGTLAGSWIGGTGNMAAVSAGIEATGTDFGLAVLADNCVYLVWIPLLLSCRLCADRFNRFVRVSPQRLRMLEQISDSPDAIPAKPNMQQLLYLICIGLGITLAAQWISTQIPEYRPVFTQSSYRILLVTTLGLLASLTPAKKLVPSHELAMALVSLFVASMGARANLSGLQDQALWFLLGAFIWITVHGLFCVLGAWLFHVDIHSTAIASAANIGGAASAPVVAAHHNPRLVPVSILMALIGYAVGNYGAYLAVLLCQWI